MFLNRLKRKTTKGILWLFILRLLTEKDMYAWEIKNELKERFGFESARVSSYVVLYSLEKSEYVEGRWEKNKKYYMITKTGEKLLADGKKYLLELSANLE